MIKCPNCGAGMYFDIKNQLLKCGSCGSKMAAAEYEGDINAEESTFETQIYLCKSCGAQLMAPGEQATAFCPYCGNQSMIESKISTFEANKIIPFKKTKEDVEKAFGNYIKGKLFVPDDYKTHSGENSFRGIYIPHYNYTVGYKPGTVIVEGHRDFDEGNQHHHMTFANEVTTGGGESENIVRDASAAFDDNLAAAIAPYSHSEATTFREGYLGDFYADIPSVDPETYDDEVKEEAVDEMKAEGAETNANALDVVLKGDEPSMSNSEPTAKSEVATETEEAEKETEDEDAPFDPNSYLSYMTPENIAKAKERIIMESRNYTVYKVENVGVSQIVPRLQTYLQDRINRGTSDPYSYYSSSGINMRTIGTSTRLTFQPDAAYNTLMVYGTKADREIVGAMLVVLDDAGLFPQPITKPYKIKVEN
ncbi:MAG: hypothetical protein IKI78_01595, partial [Clostridia bacterium]|nr:hypothetical protein [Clostridia bacterium]